MKIPEKRAKTRGIDWWNFYCPNSSHSSKTHSVQKPHLTKNDLEILPIAEKIARACQLFFVYSISMSPPI
jgi:hypothetical protein